ncbi:platelet glycoprotein IX [Neosynchiropus ocellatus]
MLSGSGLVLLLLAAPVICQSCVCSQPPPSGLQVNCSGLNLKRWPRLPADTSELHMHDNLLTEVPPGLFDSLERLQSVSLSQNPFKCDCGIQYLRSWLLKNRALVPQQPTCGSPPSVANKDILELPDNYFKSCGSAHCPGGMLTAVMVVMLSSLLVLLLWVLRLAKKSTFILKISCPEVELRPRWRRPSGRSEVSSGWTWSEELERPLVNVELLPQVLEVLHKKHNIKVKTT